MQEQIYLIQQLTTTLPILAVESQVILEAIRAIHAVLVYRDEAFMNDDKILDGAIEELDEVLDQLLSKLPSHTGLNGGKFSPDLYDTELMLPQLSSLKCVLYSQRKSCFLSLSNDVSP